MNDELGDLIGGIGSWGRGAWGPGSSYDADKLASVAMVVLKSLNQQSQGMLQEQEDPKLQVRLSVQETMTLKSFEEFKEDAFFDEKHKDFPITLKELIVVARGSDDLTSMKFFVARCLDCNCIREDFSLEDLGEFNQIFKGISFKVIEKLVLVKYKDVNKISLCDLPVLREIIAPDIVNVSKFSGLLKSVDENVNNGRYNCQNAVLYDFGFNRATSLKLKTKDGSNAFMDFERVEKIKDFIFQTLLKNVDILRQLRIVKFSKLESGRYLIEVDKDFDVERLNSLIDNIIESFSVWTAVNVDGDKWYLKNDKDIALDVKKAWQEVAAVVVSKFFIDEVFNKSGDGDIEVEVTGVDVTSYKI